MYLIIPFKLFSFYNVFYIQHRFQRREHLILAMTKHLPIKYMMNTHINGMDQHTELNLLKHSK